MRPNRICCIGADHVGTSSSSVIAFKCPEIRVTVLDNKKLISQWNSDNMPYCEPELHEIIKKCRNRNLFFSTNYTNLKDADMVFISVNPPLKSKGSGEGLTVDLKSVEDAARLIATHAETDKIVVDKTRIPLKAAESICLVLQSPGTDKVSFQVISNPEFMSEGSAAKYLLSPERVLIGCENNPNSRKAAKSLASIYESWVPKKNIIMTNHWEAEIAKISTNVLLAQRLASLNSLTKICEELGVDMGEIASILRKDSRIGDNYLSPSFAFGGFRKEILTLVYMCECLNLSEIAEYWKMIIEMNDEQKNKFFDVIKTSLALLQKKEIAIWGFAYKENTTDTKYSPAIEICRQLLSNGAKLRIYDPKVPAATIWKDLKKEPTPENEKIISICENIYTSVKNANAIVLCTPWEEFEKVNFENVKNNMSKPSYFFDGRAQIEERILRKHGFQYYSIGRRNTIISNVDQ